MGISVKVRVRTVGDWLLTGWAELGEGSSVTSSDGSAGRTELNARQSRHIIAQNSLSELNGVGDDRGSWLPFGIETLGKVL